MGVNRPDIGGSLNSGGDRISQSTLPVQAPCYSEVRCSARDSGQLQGDEKGWEPKKIGREDRGAQPDILGRLVGALRITLAFNNGYNAVLYAERLS